MPRESSDPNGLTKFPPDMWAKLQEISAARERYDKTKDLRLLNEILEAWEAVLSNPEFPHLHEGLRVAELNSTGEAYVARFQRTHQSADRDRGLTLRRQAVLLMHRESIEFPDFLSNLAKDFWERYEETHDALHLREYGELVWQLPAYHTQSFAHLTNLGIAFVTRHHETGATGDMDEAIRCFREALVRIPTQDLRIQALDNLAMTLFNRYKDTEDERHLEEYKQVIQEFPSTSAELPNHLNTLAKELWNRFERTRNAAHFEEYGQVVRQLPPSCADLPGHLNNVGTGYFSRYEATGDIAALQESVRSFEQAIAGTPAQPAATPARRFWLGWFLGRRRDQPPVPQDDESPRNKRCRYLNNLGTALMVHYSRFGAPADLEQAIQTLEQAVDRSPLGSSELAARRATLGDALRLRYLRTRVLGDLDAAIQKFDLAVVDAQRGSSDLPSVLVSRGIGLLDRYDLIGKVEDLQTAVADFRRAVDDTPATSSDRSVHLNSLGAALSTLYGRSGDMGDLDSGIAAFSEAVELTKKQRSSRPPDLATYMNNLSNALAFRYERMRVRADLETAIQYSKDVVATTDPGSPGLPSFLANLGSRLSSLYRETKEPADLDATIDTWEHGLRSLQRSYVTASVSFKVGGERTWPALYSNLVGAYLARMQVEPVKGQDDLRRAIEVAEQSKSYLLAEQFSRADMPLPADISADQVGRERQLLADLTRLDAMELAAFDPPEAKQQGAGHLQRLRQREQCRQELDRIWKLMEQAGPQAAGYVALRRGDAPIWDDLARLSANLEADTALLSLFTARDNSVIFVVRQGQDPGCIEGLVSSAGWDDIWSRLVREVHTYDRKRGGAESWYQPLRLLLEKTYEELASVKRVILAPHALGHLIPWSAAISHLGLRGAHEKPLPVVTVPTLKLAAVPRPSSSAREERALVVGNPRGDLKFAENEARGVAKKFGTEPLLRRQATKDAVLRGMADASVVHLATHAFLSKGSALDSGVVLADGVLTTREVIQLRLPTDLLVLSACETGLGTSLGGDELAGLGRAFMYAGARSMLVSLWKVDDMATAALMAAFYDAYCGGADRAEALSRAMAEVRAQERWQHSDYWGSFTLMGAWD